MQQLTEEPLRVLSRGQHVKGSAVGAASAQAQDGPKHGDLEKKWGDTDGHGTGRKEPWGQDAAGNGDSAGLPVC